MAQRAVSTKDALKHVNKRIGQARALLHLAVLLSGLLLLPFLPHLFRGT